MKRSKYVYVIVFLLLPVINSCQEDEDTIKYIRFGTTIYYPKEEGSQTRGTAHGEGDTDNYTPYMGEFKLYGFYNTTNFINGDALTTTTGTDVLWKSNGKDYQKAWPDAPTASTAVYRFYAVSPTNVSVNPDLSTIGPYNIPVNAADQKDVLFATTTAGYGEEISLEFDHLMTRVTFGVTKSPDFKGEQIKVKRVTLKGVKNGLTGLFDTTFTWQPWDGINKKNSYIDSGSSGIAVIETPIPKPEEITSFADENMFLFPQDELENITIEVQLNAPVTRTVTGTLPSGEWEMGKWMHYEIEVGVSSVKIIGTIEQWSTGGIINKNI